MQEIKFVENSMSDIIGVKKFRQLAIKQIQTFESGNLILLFTCVHKKCVKGININI
jgi:hypothetical protein